jgi:hypothetical protein
MKKRTIPLRLLLLVLGIGLLVPALIVPYSAWKVLEGFSGTAGEQEHFACGLVFGAAVHSVADPGPGILRRVRTGVRLYHAGRIDRLIFTGGRGNTSQQSEAHMPFIQCADDNCRYSGNANCTYDASSGKYSCTQGNNAPLAQNPSAQNTTPFASSPSPASSSPTSSSPASSSSPYSTSQPQNTGVQSGYPQQQVPAFAEKYLTPVSSAGITFSGRAYPLSTVSILKDGQLALTTIAGPDSKFSATISNLSSGDYKFSVYGEDKDHIRSSPFTFPIFITAGVVTNISGIFIAPTISVDKTEVKRGDNIAIFGQSSPASEIVKIH